MAVASGLWANRKIGRYLAVVLALLGSIEALALLHWIIFLPIGLSSTFLWYANLEMGLFYLAAHLAPYLVIPLMYLWIFKLLFHWRRESNEKQESLDQKSEKTLSRRAILILLLSIFLAVTAAIFPYLPTINLRNRNVGSDFKRYIEAAELVEKDLSQIFNVWHSSRPLIHMIIYGIQLMSGLNATTVVRYLPLFLNPLLVISTYLLAREIFLDELVASWASFFTVCGIQIAVGMFSFFLTNMLALSIMFLSLGFLFRAIRCGYYISLILALLMGGLLVFTHPWTFDQYYVPIILLTFYILYDDRKKDNGYIRFKMIFFYVFSLGLSDFVKSKIFHGLGGVSASSVALESIIDVSGFWYSNIFFFRRIYCGLESNVILLILSITGIYILEKVSISKLYFILLFFISSLPFIFCNAMIKSRLIYNIPFGLYSAYSFTWLNNQKNINKFKLHINFFILLSMIVYLFRSLANII
ncbi:MAG: hypothetical protein ACFFDT_00420 [Candidatus Hodarchaeota archaeon]